MEIDRFNMTVRFPLPLVAAFLLVGCGGGDEILPEPAPAESPTPTADPTPAAGPTPDRTPGAVNVEKLPPVGEPTPPKAKRWLGISVGNNAEPVAGAPDDARAVIQRAFVGGPAQLAGLRRGDVIVQAGPTPVKRYQDYLAEARKIEIGDVMQVRVLRDGKPIDVEMRMVEKPRNMKGWRRDHFSGTDAFAWDVEGLRPGGARLTSAAAGDKPQVLYFWATWCGPCRRTSPKLQAAFTEYGDKIQFVAISNEELDVLTEHVAASSKTYPVGRDDTGYAKWDYEVQSLPTAVLLNDGQVVSWDYGVQGISRILERSRTLVAP